MGAVVGDILDSVAVYVTFADVTDAVLALTDQPGALSVMSEKAARVCDGKGIARILVRLAA